MNKLINVNIKNENGKLLVGSRDIAVGLEKEHKDVLRKIEDVLTVGEFSEREFTTSQGNKYKEYLTLRTVSFSRRTPVPRRTLSIRNTATTS